MLSIWGHASTTSIAYQVLRKTEPTNTAGAVRYWNLINSTHLAGFFLSPQVVDITSQAQLRYNAADVTGI